MALLLSSHRFYDLSYRSSDKPPKHKQSLGRNNPENLHPQRETDSGWWEESDTCLYMCWPDVCGRLHECLKACVRVITYFLCVLLILCSVCVSGVSTVLVATCQQWYSCVFVHFLHFYLTQHSSLQSGGEEG